MIVIAAVPPEKDERIGVTEWHRYQISKFMGLLERRKHVRGKCTWKSVRSKKLDSQTR